MEYLFIVPLLLSAFAAPAVHAQEGVTVSGEVIFQGTPPKRRPIDVGADEYCEELHADVPLLTDDPILGPNGEFANIFVWIANPPEGEYAPPNEPIELHQLGCRYTSPMFGMMVGQTLEVHNDDETTHNVRGFPENNRVFNFGQPPGLAPRTRVFENPEFAMKVKCDVHGWMKSIGFVMEHPFFAVTNTEGEFEMANVPPGTYTLKTWHEKLGELEQLIVVGDEPVAAMTFAYQRPGAKP